MISHPQVVHFPIDLLIVALLFEIISYFWRNEEFSLFSLILLTLGAFIALQTGEAAAEITDKITGIGSILHEHEETAELVIYIYLGIVIFKTFLIRLKKDLFPWRLIVLTGLLVGTFFLYRVGYYGGQLVYEWGAGVKPVLKQVNNQSVDE